MNPRILFFILFAVLQACVVSPTPDGAVESAEIRYVEPAGPANVSNYSRVEVDPAFFHSGQALEMDAVFEGLELWNKAIGNLDLEFVVGYGLSDPSALRVVRRSGPRPVTENNEHVGGSHQGDVLYIWADGLTLSQIRAVAAHELGHALGAGHVGIKSAVMNAKLDSSIPVCVTLDDVEPVCDGKDCGETKAACFQGA